MGNIGFTELLVIGGILMLLFGSKKIPEFAKGLGEGLRIFKKELNQKPEELSPSKTDQAPTKS